ncbi:hypothetical protein ACEWY4_011327 [Coilia grayii]|uniref:Uncharacterized protein n=1 Tax=Coilia grayii TaxID=363190 RepID=A0ABD1K4F7_9TELE
MNRLNKSVRDRMRSSVRTELESVFRDISLEIKEKEKTLRATMESFSQDMSQLDTEIKAARGAWKTTKKTLIGKLEAARKTAAYNCTAEKRSMIFAVKGERERKEEEDKKLQRVENEHKLIQEHLNKVDDDDTLAEKEKDQSIKDFFTHERLSNERVHKVVTGGLRTAGLKQRLLAQLRLPRSGKAEKVLLQETELEEDPRLQALRESFEQKEKELRAEMSKGEEKIRDTRLTENRNLDRKMSKVLERIQAKELKLAKEREEKEKKREEEGEVKHRAEEGQRRWRRFISWCIRRD